MSFATQHSLLAPLKAFFKWLAKENHILYNPASEFDLPRIPKRLPKHILSPEEIHSVLNHTRIYGQIGIRDRAARYSTLSTELSWEKILCFLIDLRMERDNARLIFGVNHCEG